LRLLVMKKVKYKTGKLHLIFFLFTLIFLFPVSVIANDPPHNDASGVTCGGCHGDVLFSTDPTGQPDEVLHDMYEAVCNRCHFSAGGNFPPYHSDNAPVVLGHNVPVPEGHGTPRCVDCHHPHYQTKQTYYGRRDHPSAYEIAVATGSVVAKYPSPDITGNPDVTEISYTGMALKNGWSG
jgi:hypothetical protein